MIRDVVLHSYKKVVRTELSDLSHINVICGKNNSGKSSILEALNDTASRSTGNRHSIEAVTSLVRKSAEGFANASSQLRQQIESIIHSRICWYEVDTLELDRLLVNGVGSRWQNLTTAVSLAICSPVQQITSSVLLPAKREPQLTAVANAQEDIKPNGKGVINLLFKLKNDHRESPSRKKYEQLETSFNYVSEGLEFDLKLEEDTSVCLYFKSKQGPFVRAEDCGLGLQELFALLFFCTTYKTQLVLIEEPESHLHADMQRRLLQVLKNQADRQFFISSHSNVFLDNRYIDKIIRTTFDSEVRVADVTSRAELLNDLGYSVNDNLVSDLVILVEGPSDKPVIEAFLNKMGLTSKYNIRVWPLGGDIMQYVDLSVFQQSYKIRALIDSDPGSSVVRTRFCRKCDDANIVVTKLERYAIENYFTLDAIRSVYPEILDSITLDPSTKLESVIGKDVKKNNRKIAQNMELSDLEGTDLLTFLNALETELGSATTSS